MFFTGTLQEGIAASIQQGKPVVCFVTDEGEESQLWENEFLTDTSISSKVADESIALRLKAGSEEAGHLAAIFPLPKTPTLVVIKGGDLKGYIVAGTSKEDFITKVSASFQAVSQSAPAAPSQPAPAPAQSTPPAAAAPQQQPQSQPETQQQPSSSSSSRGTPVPTPEEGSTNSSSSNVQDFLAERRARLEAQRKEDERKAKEERAAKAAAATSDPSPEAVQTRKRAEQLRKQRQDAADERSRILQRIEADKMERLAAKDERMRQRQQQQQQSEKGKEKAAEPKIGDVAAALASAESSPMRPSSGQAALQVRLLDGSSIRTRFAAGKASLRNEVRRWVDEKRTDGSAQPYVFKLVLPPPQGSRKIDETEEEKTLAELGMAPSATLVLAPVQRFAEAYDPTGRRGGLSGMILSAFGFVVGLFAWLWGLVTGVFSGPGGREERRDGQGADSREAAERAASEAQAARVREQRRERFAQFNNADDRRRDQQLYNGNSLNFEPRPDDVDKPET